MGIRIYNTLSGKKEDFEPVEPGKVMMYVCGPTVYDSSHIGHARSVVVFDVVARYFESQGFDLTYVRNFTDIDDKIIKRANELGISIRELSEKYINEFHRDMDALNVRRAHIEPKATEYVREMIDFVEALIRKDRAYAADGDVYFQVETFPGYGKLSGRSLEDMQAGARIEVDPKKKNPFDFVLWKAAKPGEPSWESPWGKGRPGWHIECSVMSLKHLGETFDIHGGGKDLIFPHHENEIAQSEGRFEKPFARYWMHNGFVNIDKEKMSKSLGNFLMIKDVLNEFHPEAIRLFLLSKHYRSPIDYTPQAVSEAGAALDKIYNTLSRIEEKGITKSNSSGGHNEKFIELMNDDFNTAGGIGVLFDAVRQANRILDMEEIADNDRKTLSEILHDIKKMADILGIAAFQADTYLQGKKAIALEKEGLDSQSIEKMIEERNMARKNKDFKTADQIRDTLAQKHVILEDRPEGTIWRYEQ